MPNGSGSCLGGGDVRNVQEYGLKHFSRRFPVASMKDVEPNPYESPTIAEVLAANATGRRKFRWRIIPVTLLLIYGVGLAVGATASSLFALLALLRLSELPWEPRVSPWYFLFADGVAIVIGILLISTATSLWKARWRAAGFTFASAVLLGLAAWSTASFLGIRGL
jgi:hypothetical protein